VDPCNVFVKYLPPELNDSGLYTLFLPFGMIASAKVMVDHQTGNSLGYGFVRFASGDEAQNAIQNMNGQRIGNKTLLCKLSNTSPTTASPSNVEPSTNLYVKPLLGTTTEEDLKVLFGAFGTILDVKVMVDKQTGVSRQIGFVRFQGLDEASAALHAMNGKQLEATSPPLIVKYAESEQQKQARRVKHQHQQQVKQQQVLQTTAIQYNPYMFMPSGQAQALSGVYGSHLPQLSMPMSSMTSIAGLPGLPNHNALDQSQLWNTAAGSLSPQSSALAGYSGGGSSSGQGVNLFIFHLPSDVDDAGLYRLFSPFGALESVKVMADRNTGASKGYGFVKYLRAQDAMQAISAMNGLQLGNKHLKVTKSR